MTLESSQTNNSVMHFSSQRFTVLMYIVYVNLLGFSINSEYYYDKTLPMGLSYSCSLFEQFSTALHWIALNKLGVHDCVHVSDDFLFVVPAPIDLCIADLAKFFEIAKTLEVPIKDEKTVPPTTCIAYWVWSWTPYKWELGSQRTN